MLKNFSFILFLCVGFSFSQTKALDELKETSDYFVRNNSPNEGFLYIDKKLSETTDIKEQQVLKTVKLFPLSQVELFDTMMTISNDLLEDPNLNIDLKIIVHLRRALVYEIFEDFNRSKTELDLANILIQEHPEQKDEKYGELLYRYASLYRVYDNFTLANEYIDKSIAFSTKNKYNDVAAVAYMVKGFLISNNDISEKKNYFNLALYNYKTHSDSIGISSMYYNLADLYYTENNLNKAFIYTDSVMHYSKNFEYSFAFAQTHHLKSELYKKQNKLDSSLFFLEEYYHLKEALSYDRQLLKVKDIENNFLLEKEQIKRDNVFYENEKIKSFNAQLKSFIYSLIAALALFITALILIARKNKIIRETRHNITFINKELQKNVAEKEFLLKELNHRVKNNLSLIISLVNFQAIETKDAYSKLQFETLRQRIEAIAIVHEDMMGKSNSKLDDKHNINEYINKIGDSLIKLDTRTVVFHPQILNIEVSIDIAVPLGILINELISNSIKHAVVTDKLEIFIEISEENEYLNINYSDNGSSFYLKESGHGLGLFIIESMVKQLKGNLKRNGFYYIIKVLKNK